MIFCIFLTPLIILRIQINSIQAWASLNSGIVPSAAEKNDYLQPYKFVKPLKDLADLYQKAAEKKEDVDDLVEEEAKESEEVVPDVIQSRSGEAHPIEEKSKSPLMSDELSPPAPAKVVWNIFCIRLNFVVKGSHPKK